METFFFNFSNTNLVVELLTPKNLASCRHLRVREGSWPTNQRTWRQVIKPLMRKGVAAKILEIIRYSPFFNFEYNLLTLYNFVSMHFFPKIFIQQLVSLLAFNAKKYSKIVNTLQTVEISFCQKFQLWVTDEIWSFKLNLCTTTTTVHFYQDKFGQIWWYFSLRKIPQQNLVKYSDRSGWNFPVYI